MRKYIKEISLIHGVKDLDNKLIKKIQIRSLNGFDEEFMNEMETQDLPYPVKTSRLLNRIVNFYDDDNDNDNEKYDENAKLALVRNITIGDRSCIIFYLRQLTFGDIFQFDVQCDSCKKFMSIDLSIATILDHSLSKQNKQYVLDEDTDFYKLKFSDFIAKIRLLNGLDQENISLYDINETKILESCVVNIDTIGHEKLLDEKFVSKINLALSELDPLSDILLTLICPSCNTSFKIPLIVEDFFFKEIQSRINNLEFEVHWLALNYHWSESEILSLPLPKRKRYVDLVNNTLVGEINNG
ncbi:MAG: hypothetical protein ACRD6U_04265 [Nitrososphaeraceae archaeon]